MNKHELAYKYTVKIICTLRGYDEGEFEQWIHSGNDNFDPECASEYADVYGLLTDLLDELNE